MSNNTNVEVLMIQLGRGELQAMLDAAADNAVVRASERSGELWGPTALAEHLGVSVATVHNMRRENRLPPRHSGARWRKADVLRWERERRPL